MQYILPKISPEQQKILDNLNTHNIVVDAVAGSGKTTCHLFTTLNNLNKKILLLTYNKKLKLETRCKCVLLDFKNIEIHSYHSFCVKYYDRECYTDKIILSILKTNIKNILAFNYDIIIIDESQDISPIYYELICKIFKDNLNKNINIIITGDEYQSIYDFNKADSRYIKYSQDLYNFNNKLFLNINLSQSFRITHQMAQFINTCMLKQTRITSVKNGVKPRYIITNSHNSNLIFQEIKYYLSKNYKYSDIFILAPSVKNEKSPIKKLANKLSKNKIPIYVPSSEEEKLDEEILQNKITFSTYHQSKGLERPIVFVYGFDSSYFKYFKRNSNVNVCPNELYVATTRALDHLILIHHIKNNFLQFIDKDKLNMYSNLEIDNNLDIKDIKEENKEEDKEHSEDSEDSKNSNINTSVSDLTKHLPVEVISHALTYINVTTIRPPNNKIIDIPMKTKQDNLYELVSEITGIAIPVYYELVTTKKTNITTNLDLTNFTIEKLLLESNIYNARRSGYTFKLTQIINYDWVTKDHLINCFNRLTSILSKNSRYEILQDLENVKELQNRKLIGYIDAIDNKKIYEIKCVNSLSDDHILQLSMYAYLVKKKLFLNNKQTQYQYFLYNVLNDHLIEVTSSLDNLILLVEYLITQKYSIKEKLSNEEFISFNKNIKEKYN